MKKLFLLLCIFLSFALIAGADISNLLQPYKTIQSQLAADSVEKVADAAAVLESSAQKSAKETKDAATLVQLKKIQETAAKLKTADLKTARTLFKGLSLNLIELQNASGKSVPVFHCSMIDGYWIQDGSKPANPYYGKEMLECGEKVDSSKVKKSK